MSVTIEQDLKEILGEINKKLETLQKDVADIKIELVEAKGEREVLKTEINSIRAELKTEINSVRTEAKGEREILKTEINTIKEDVKEIKRLQQAQIWTLIGVLITAVGGFLVAVGKFVISGNP